MKTIKFLIIMTFLTQTIMAQEINKQNTAMVVVEFQQTWTGKTFFNRLIRKEYESRNVYQNTKKLLDFAREKGVLIIQAPLYLDKTDKDNYKKIPFQPKLFRQFTANTWKAEYTEGIFKSTDIEVSGRCGFDACEGSNLEQLLSANKIKNLYVVGFTTDHCVAMTIETLTKKGYNCYFVSDCTATMNNKKQMKIEKKLKNLTSIDLIKKMTKF